jgi:D-3-phosphoglycerate dehydrogenase
MNNNVLITDKVHDVLVNGLSQAGWHVTYNTDADNAFLDHHISAYAGVVINSKIIMDRHRLDKGKSLKFIGRLGSGLEIIDVAHATRKNIAVYNSPEGNSNAVAEHEFGMILALLNNLISADREVRQGIWQREKNRGRELKGMTVGIIGLGHTGTAFAEKLASWDVQVVSYDKYKVSYPKSVNFVHKTSLEQVCRDSDIISLHLPLTPETRHLVNEEFIAKCKNGVIFSNTSRGPVMDTKALLQAIREGKVSGACLDVFENEKPDSFSPQERSMYKELYALDNVVLSPHIAGWTAESLYKIARVLLEKIDSGNHLEQYISKE